MSVPHALLISTLLMKMMMKMKELQIFIINNDNKITNTVPEEIQNLVCNFDCACCWRTDTSWALLAFADLLDRRFDRVMPHISITHVSCIELQVSILG